MGPYQSSSVLRRGIPAEQIGQQLPVPSLRTIVVAHSCQVVSIGIANTLARLPDCNIHTVELLESQDSLETLLRDDAILVCDLASLARIAPDRSGQNAINTSSVLLLLIGSTAADRRALSELHTKGAKACIPIDCRAQELLEAVARLTSANSNGASRPLAVGGLTTSARRRVREFIADNIDRKIEIEDLATLTGLSTSQFSRAFRESFGSPPYRYVLDLRVGLAADLIRTTEKSLVDVSLNAGFADQSHFTRTFTKLMGDTPASFRRGYR